MGACRSQFSVQFVYAFNILVGVLTLRYLFVLGLSLSLTMVLFLLFPVHWHYCLPLTYSGCGSAGCWMVFGIS